MLMIESRIYTVEEYWQHPIGTGHGLSANHTSGVPNINDSTGLVLFEFDKTNKLHFPS